MYTLCRCSADEPVHPFYSLAYGWSIMHRAHVPVQHECCCSLCKSFLKLYKGEDHFLFMDTVLWTLCICYFLTFKTWIFGTLLYWFHITLCMSFNVPSLTVSVHRQALKTGCTIWRLNVGQDTQSPLRLSDLWQRSTWMVCTPPTVWYVNLLSNS